MTSESYHQSRGSQFSYLKGRKKTCFGTASRLEQLCNQVDEPLNDQRLQDCSDEREAVGKKALFQMKDNWLRVSRCKAKKLLQKSARN